jgi:nitrous oxide reductase accessory protein NosL
MSINNLQKTFSCGRDCFFFVSGVVFLFVLLTGTALLWGEETGFIKPGPNDKCAACGMYVSGHPKWIAEIIFKDGSHQFFDGPKCMFKYYFNMSKYKSKHKANDIPTLFVTEYYQIKILSARDVFFILGSDVIGPMGNELIPVQGKKAAKQFFKDHHGKSMITLDEVTPESIQSLGKK